MPYTWAGNKNAYVPTGHYGYPDYVDGALRTPPRSSPGISGW